MPLRDTSTVVHVPFVIELSATNRQTLLLPLEFFMLPYTQAPIPFNFVDWSLNRLVWFSSL